MDLLPLYPCFLFVFGMNLYICIYIYIFVYFSNWGDHCGMVAQACRENGKSVVTHRTPSGLREGDWRKGLELYRQAHSNHP